MINETLSNTLAYMVVVALFSFCLSPIILMIYSIYLLMTTGITVLLLVVMGIAMLLAKGLFILGDIEREK